MKCFRVLVCLWIAIATALAQSDRGTITGRVVDASGAAIANANITASNVATGLKYPAVSSSTGSFVIPLLPVGTYELAVEAAGFRRYVRRDLTVNIAETITANVNLEIGQVEQAIEVTGDAPVVSTTTSELGTTVPSKNVLDLPLAVSGNMRNPEAFIFLAPGVTGDTTNTQINGSQSRAKEILIDGVGSTSPESGGLLFTYPSVEAFSEFKLVSGTFNAEYGRTGGGFEVFTTRSGTNEVHGSLFEYFRNDVLDARGFFATSTPVNRQNEFGVSIGGPVVVPKLYDGRNRTFFHFVYSGFRFRSGAANEFVTIPTLEMRRGDFSRFVDRTGQQIVIYDPATTRPTATGFTRDPFPGNIIPQERFSRVARNILPLLPTPTNDNAVNNFAVIGNRIFDRDQYNGKIDHSFSERHRISSFIYWGEQASIAPERLPGPFTNALDEQRPSRWVRFNYDFLLSPNSINNFIAGFTREPQLWRKLSADQDWPNRIGLTGVNTGPGNVFPTVTFNNGMATWGDDAKNVGAQVNNTYQVSDSFQHIRGNHSYKFGGEFRWLQTNGADPFNQQGRFNFDSLGTGLPGRAGTGDAFATFLLGDVQSATYNGLFVVPANRYEYMALYAQDDWKITRKLTLNYGLRWEVYFPRREKFNNMSGFDPDAPNPGAGGRPGAVVFLGEGQGRSGGNRFANTDYGALGPRLGIAYALNDKTAIRTGYGVYYAPGNATAGLRSSQGFSFGFNAAPAYASTNAGVTPAFNWDQGFPTNGPRPPFIDPTVQNGANVNYIGRDDGRPPRFQNWTFSIQRELPGAFLVEGAYVGNRGTRLGTGLFNNINQVDPRYLELGALLTRPIDSPEARAANIPIPYAGFRGSVAQALRPYPQYLNIENRSNPGGSSTYHAFQAKVDKRFSKGLSLLGAYTWSKTISDSDIQAGGGPSGQDFYNRRLEKSVSTNDVPHIVALSYIYELPFGTGRRWLSDGVLGRVVGGWSITGIHQYQSGRPITLTANNTLPIFNLVLRPDAVSGQVKQFAGEEFDPARDRWINPSAFAVPAPLRFGNAARAYTDLRAPAFLNESFGAIKRTPITERVVLTFRAEFFNAFNRVVFAAPDSNVSVPAQFGRIGRQANTPRQGQLALRLEF